MSMVLCVVGTRREPIMMAPVVRAFREFAGGVSVSLCRSGRPEAVFEDSSCVRRVSGEPHLRDGRGAPVPPTDTATQPLRYGRERRGRLPVAGLGFEE